MFTGIIESIGTVEAIEEGQGVRRIRFGAPGLAGELDLGDSIAVDGACLTVERATDAAFESSLVATTLARTIAATYQVGSRVNLERAARIGARLDGHIVQGHVDGKATLVRVEEDGETRLFDFELPREITAQSVPHGSIALNGVSLTINELRDEGICQVAIIPHTWSHTTFADLVTGDVVNVEGDLMGKYVGRMLASYQTGR